MLDVFNANFMGENENKDLFHPFHIISVGKTRSENILGPTDRIELSTILLLLQADRKWFSKNCASSGKVPRNLLTL